jgi:hypothetical protein
MLSFYDFILLNKTDRAQMLWQDGEFIIHHQAGAEMFALYSLHGFYVEVTMFDSAIISVLPFKSGARLDKYLSEINIEELAI